MIKENNLRMSDKELLILIISGIKFTYFSYDHKEATKEYSSDNKYEEERKWIRNPKSWEIPIELKEKYRVEKVGKLRRIEFSPSGRVRNVYIGNKYAKRFSLDDFGINVFPILEKQSN